MDANQGDSRVAVIESKYAGILHNYAAFYVHSQNIAYYIGKNSDIEIPGKTLVEANGYFGEKVLRSAVRELDTYLRGHMAERGMYRTERFWKDALKYAGRTIIPHMFWIDFRSVPYGYCILHTSDCKGSCSYNFIDNTFTFQSEKKENDPAPTLMEFCYHGFFDQLLAHRHVEAGTAPDAYMEIARINGFLRDKRSIHCVFKNGKSCQSFSSDPFTADCIINEAHGKFVINPNGYREMPGTDAGLPVMLRHYATEFQFNPEVFNNLDIEIDNPGIKQARERDDVQEKIAGMIPDGTWYPFCKVKLTTAEGHTQIVYHPSHPDSRDDLLNIGAVKAFICKYCDKTNLCAETVQYSIGVGIPAPMPDEVFALLGQLGGWRWNELPHYAEGSANTVAFDAGCLYDLFYGKEETSWEKELSLLRGKIKASIPEGVSYDFSMVQIMGEHDKTEDTVSGEVDDEDTIRELPLFFAFYEGHQEETEVYVVTRCFRAGIGTPCDMPEDLLKLIKEYGVEDVAMEKIVRTGSDKTFTIRFKERIGDGSGYDGGIATRLMPKSVRNKLKKSPLYSKEKLGKSAEVVVKYFNPCGAGTWLITEGEEQENGDWLLFGMIHIQDWAWGYVLLSELEECRAPLGLKIERDLYSSGTVAELKGEMEDAA